MQAFSSRINIPLLHEPRNDTETVGFRGKPTVFISEMFEIRRGMTPLLTAATPVCPQGKFHGAASAGPSVSMTVAVNRFSPA